jgi:hypothetical protein
MTKPAFALISVLMLAGPALAQDRFQSFTPVRDSEVPTFMNAEVVRVDRAADTLTIRAESGETALRVDRDALPGLATYRAGDKVIVSYRTVVDEDGRSLRMLTSIRPTSPSSGSPAITTASGTGSGGASARNVRVVSVDAGRRSLVVEDATGLEQALIVNRGAAIQLSSLNPGDLVGLSFGSGVVGAVPTVSGIQPLPTGTVLDTSLFPPVGGELVRFDPNTNRVVLMSDGRRQTFAVSPTAAQELRGASPGDNLSLGFNVTTNANQSTGTGILTRGGLARATLATGVSPVSTQSLMVTGVQPLAPGLGALSAGAARSGAAGQTGTFGPINVGGVGTGVVSGGIAVPSAVPSAVGGTFSVFNNPVPSIPAPTPVMNTVLPPAIAKAPLAADDVGLMREQGIRDLDAAALVLAMQANEVDVAWFRYKTACLPGFTPESSPSREWFLVLEGRVPTPTDDGCRLAFASLQSMASGFAQQSDIAVDAARKADVLPGTIREILDRHRLER